MAVMPFDDDHYPEAIHVETHFLRLDCNPLRIVLQRYAMT